LNFSEFGNYSKLKQANKLEEIVKQIKADEMPLASYTLIHRNAVLSTTQKKEVIAWISTRKDSVSKGF
jgi:DNA invertase Pin-like site-specific DNA recombinase